MTELGISTLHIDADAADRRGGTDRRDDTPKLQISWAMVAQIVGYVVALFAVYSAMTSRLTALETYRQVDSMRMERIENKLDAVLSLGHKP